MQKKVWIFLIFGLFSFLTACATTTNKPQQLSDANEISPAEELNQTKLDNAARINVRLGAAYLERKDTLRAKQKFLLALKEGPKLPEVWYSMAYYFESTGNNELAKEYYTKALALAPKRGDVLNNYGTYLCRNKQYQSAIQNFLLAVRDREYLDPASAYENAALCAKKIPDVALAIQLFSKALQEDPNRATSLIELAELHYKTQELSLARFELNRFLEISPPTPQSVLLEKNIEKSS